MSSHNGNSVHSLMHHEDEHETVEMTTFSHETKDTKDSTLLPAQEEGTITDENQVIQIKRTSLLTFLDSYKKPIQKILVD